MIRHEVPTLFDWIDEDIALLDRRIAAWVADGSSEDASRPIRTAQSALAIRIVGAIRHWLGTARTSNGAAALAMLDPLRSDASLESRQARLAVLMQRLHEVVKQKVTASRIEASDR